MMGMHASFTLSDATIEQCVGIANDAGVGCHIHVAEDAADRADSLAKYNIPTVKRLQKLGVTGEKSIFVHCVHIDEAEMDILASTRTSVVHNPESNMNNAVGNAALKLLGGRWYWGQWHESHACPMRCLPCTGLLAMTRRIWKLHSSCYRTTRPLPNAGWLAVRRDCEGLSADLAILTTSLRSVKLISLSLSSDWWMPLLTPPSAKVKYLCRQTDHEPGRRAPATRS
jgi:hypothetical protein